MAKRHKEMAGLLIDKFGSARIGVLPIDHGGAKEALALREHLPDDNFFFYTRPYAVRPEEECLDQSNLYVGEVRRVVTPPGNVAQFMEGVAAEKAVLLDDWSTEGAPSLLGGWYYAVKHAHRLGIRPEDVYTAVFMDQCGAADIAVERYRPTEYRSTREFASNHAPNAYSRLLNMGVIFPADDDSIYTRLFETPPGLFKRTIYRLFDNSDELLARICLRGKDERKDNFARAAMNRLFRNANML